ncbi:1,2-phenylacetyl-CoA epoxidase subunit PaaD [Actinocatenispora rupis]|uniref:Phenylacetate-CoA oxygenase subunit PaaJ n=1 Tax=Actinocatenispora rupis TaxID=519421 RepID=A0A8J3JIK4_9ACTN|nr:1,2-phenylacetyl-CoA epoxidase subunit PaaD [Actinocatenispora rupis]GID15633.1 phenylacetate-CoA oxygenase subunit PaaJ [Actinocatenispora rupis]
MVTGAGTAPAAAVALREIAGAVPDPELRVVSIAELGILRDVSTGPQGTVVTITPTYSGCPALATIAADVRDALAAAGAPDAEVRVALDPPWSTDDITAAGRAKLAGAGIAPPGPTRLAGPVALPLAVRCPRCGSAETVELSRFSATPCTALWRCTSCAEPFDRVKEH